MPGIPAPVQDPSPAIPFAERTGEAAPLGSGEHKSVQRRWSADGWVLWRRGNGNVQTRPRLFFPSYGASQAGAVLRYRLSRDSAHRPALYLRATTALDRSGDRELAGGLSVRPLRSVPVSLSAEARLSANAGTTSVRPAVLAVSELPPFKLPLGMRAEAYGQAGYVGGKFATAFADGQLRADRHISRLGPAELRLGGGVWGGAQKGAGRLDAGPSLTLAGNLGGSAGLRLAADWRFRLAGDALPGSGPAITLSAGF